MIKLLIATRNPGKKKEILNILSDLDIEVSTLSDVGFHKEIVEDGDTFYDNALIKAKEIHKLYPGYYVLADDSGLRVNYLNGEPGVYSARYAGENSTQDMLIDKLLDKLKNAQFEKRTASFVCVMVLLSPDDLLYKAKGECFGTISLERKGAKGFGYDPVFLSKEYDHKKTFAEIALTEKNKISHRAMAMLEIRSILEKIDEN